MEAAASPADTNQPAVGDGTGWEMRYRKVMDRLKAPKDETTLSLEPGVCCRETRSLNSTKVKQDSFKIVKPAGFLMVLPYGCFQK